MIQLAEMLPPTPSALWTLARQMGLENAVGGLPFGDPQNGTDAPWDFMPLLRTKQRYESAGFKLAVIEARPPYNLVKRACRAAMRRSTRSARSSRTWASWRSRSGATSG